MDNVPCGVLVLLKFWQFSSKLTKTWSSGATECRVWIANCNVKVRKSSEHKLHNIWRSVKFKQNEHTPAHFDNIRLFLSNSYKDQNAAYPEKPYEDV